MKKTGLSLALVFAAAAATLVALLVGRAAPAALAASGASCSGSVGLMGPFTGPAASIGKEQLNWAKFAIEEFNAKNGTSWKGVEGDTQLNAANAATVATRFAADKSIFGIVGPAGSQEVLATGPIYKKAGTPFISASATNPVLTNGQFKPVFFRVVPNDAVQGKTDAYYTSDVLKATNVYVIDDQTDYSRPLANIFQRWLGRKGVKSSRDSVSQQQSDFSSIITKIGDDVDYIFLPWQLAAKAQVFAQQLAEQGKKAVIFGSDGLDTDDFKVEGAYVSAFAPDINGIAADADVIAAYTKKYGKFASTFGPPMYLATRTVLDAMTKACNAGSLTRAAVTANIAKTSYKTTILGFPLRFAGSGEVIGAKFFIFQWKGGKKVLVG